jgi:hypothetical protein
MQGVETKTKSGEELMLDAAAEMRNLAAKLAVNASGKKRLMLSCMEILLADPDLFCDDFVKWLEEEKQIFTDSLSGADKKDEDDKRAGDITTWPTGKLLSTQQLIEKRGLKAVGYVLDSIKQTLDTYLPEFQQDILLCLLSEMPEKVRKQQAENEQGDARDELVELILELPPAKQVSVCKILSSQVAKHKDALVAEVA